MRYIVSTLIAIVADVISGLILRAIDRWRKR